MGKLVRLATPIELGNVIFAGARWRRGEEVHGHGAAGKRLVRWSESRWRVVVELLGPLGCGDDL